MHREADAREFAAGRDLRDRLDRLARVRAHPELDAVRAGCLRLRFGVGFDRDLEPATGHAELAHEARDGIRELARRAPARRAESGRCLDIAPAQHEETLVESPEGQFRFLQVREH